MEQTTPECKKINITEHYTGPGTWTELLEQPKAVNIKMGRKKGMQWYSVNYIHLAQDRNK
jgi:hypothetical protein